MQSKEQQYIVTVKSLEDKVEGCRQAKALLERQLAAAKDKLGVQIEVNKEIMRRKESIEWELMQFQAEKVHSVLTYPQLNISQASSSHIVHHKEFIQ